MTRKSSLHSASFAKYAVASSRISTCNFNRAFSARSRDSSICSGVTGLAPPALGLPAEDALDAGAQHLSDRSLSANRIASRSQVVHLVVGALARTSSVRVAREVAHEQLKIVRMDHRSTFLAGGLPIGERKKLEIARALATKPEMLLLDEVMGGLERRAS